MRTLTRQANNLREGDILVHDSALYGYWTERVIAVELYSPTSKRPNVRRPIFGGGPFVGLWTARGVTYPDWKATYTIKRGKA